MTWRSVAAAGVVVGLCGGVVFAGSLVETPVRSASADASTREFLRTALRSCPGQVTPDDASAVAAVAVPGTRGQNVPGRITIADDRDELSAVTKPGATAVATDPSPGSTPRVSADGGLAPGLLAAQVVTDPRGEGKGLESAPCVAAGTEAWLWGAGAEAGQRSVIVLMNPTESDSLVDLTAYGKGGPVETTGDDGVTVPASGTVRVRVDSLVPRLDAVAVRVRTRTGLVAAALRDERMNGLTPMGADIGVGAAPPARSVVLAGVPAGGGERSLHLLAPHGDGSVRLTALTENGPLPLLAGEPVQLKKGSLSVLDLTDELAGRVSAVRVSGDVDVIAGLVATTAVDESVKARRESAVAAAERAVEEAKGDAQRRAAQTRLTRAETANAIDPGEDFAFFAAAPRLAGRAGVTGLSADLDTTILVTAVGGALDAELALLPGVQSGAQPVPRRTVAVAEGSTVAVPVRAPRGVATYSVIVRRVSGPGQLHAGHVQLDDGRSLTGYAVDPLQVWLPAPRAIPDYDD